MLSASQWTSQGTILTCQGPSGLQGPQGVTGPTGPSGPQGATGTRGNQGLIGDGGIGGFNPDGPPGQFSFIGDNGPSGAIGPSGPAGPQGNTGATGSRGVSGPVGPSGAIGLIGRMGGSGPTGPTGPTGPKGPAAANYTIVAQGTKFYASNGIQILYTFTDLDKNIRNYVGYYRLAAADLTTATGPVSQASVYLNHEFVIMPTENFRFSTGPTGAYSGNTIQPPDDIDWSVVPGQIRPYGLQPFGNGAAIYPNNTINDNTTVNRAEYNVVVDYIGTRPMLLNWYLYKANLSLPIYNNITFDLVIFPTTLFSLPAVSTESIEGSLLFYVFVPDNGLVDRWLSRTVPDVSTWRVGSVSIPQSSYNSRQEIADTLTRECSRFTGRRPPGSPTYRGFPTLSFSVRPDGKLQMNIADTTVIDVGVMLGIAFNAPPNGATILGCNNAGLDLNRHGVTPSEPNASNRGMMIYRPDPVYFGMNAIMRPFSVAPFPILY